MSISGNIPSQFPGSGVPAEERDTSTPQVGGAESAARPKGEDAAPAREDVLLDHEYDGILEYDNPMPAWWKNIFWGTFVFSLGYLFWYHLGGNGVSVEAAYEADVAEARALAAKEALSQAVSEESLAQLVNDQGSLAEAATKFAGVCSPCHGDKGQGLIGPNLTDDHWLHGSGSLMEIYEVVAKGVPEKGMPPWERQLSPEELRKVVAFVGSMKGTNVPGKAPEGTPVTPAQ
jgi:cytochrome c oxidase cbb3-type subunit 3